MAITSALSLFLSAFLLFLIQPILGKMILPWFGGTPAVWTTCMLFFQVLLLGGYTYAALLTRFFKPVRQATIHLALVMVAISMLPITPSPAWKPPDGELPVVRILLLLCACVGAPYFLLSATSPLLQSWFAQACPGRSPYRLYALSNIGSLGALLVYPFVIEPAITTSQQGWFWSGLFGLFAIGCAVLTMQLWRIRVSLQANESATRVVAPTIANPIASISPVESPSWRVRSIWLLLPALASMMLLAVTNHLCQDVAVVPFLWIVPLSLYLLSLIICFDRDHWYSRRWFSIGTIIAILIACDLSFVSYLAKGDSIAASSRLWVILRFDIRLIIGVYLTLFFLICMVCHGEVVRRRPVATRLTEFYLTIAAGGALGGFIVAVVCPNWCTSFIELKVGLILGFIVSLVVFLSDIGFRVFNKKANTAKPKREKPDGKRSRITETRSVASLSNFMNAIIGVLAVLLLIVVAGAQWLSLDESGASLKVRNFYGTLTIRDWFDEEANLQGRALYHGAILHGYQLVDGQKELQPTTYYTEKSGVGLAMKASRREHPIKVGVVGLGVGTLAAYGQPSDHLLFYEINPLVIQLASKQFTFLSRSLAKIDVVSGDARLSLEREAPQHFDLLVLDAFSGDSIPVHLLTREAMELYLRHLKPDGMIAVHVSNRYIDLLPVVSQLGNAFQLHQAKVNQDQSHFLEISPSDWILLAPNAATLRHPELNQYVLAPKGKDAFPVWTDDYNNLFQFLRRM